MLKQNTSVFSNKAKLIRLKALENVIKAQKGHLGGTFSCVEILVSLYYGGFINIDPAYPKDVNRYFFIMGKGHGCLALYPILLDLGFINLKRYNEYGCNGSSIGGQLDLSIPGVEYNTGSLGHALGICAGYALASKIDGRKNKAISLIGDAECDEGAIWEAIIFAGDMKLNNLICIVDRNKLAVTKVIKDSSLFRMFKQKIETFNWNCLEINGHDYDEICKALKDSYNSKKPTVILADTIKGKGISFMENEIKWHHTVPTLKELEIAKKELK